jgi:DNA helicase-2/ATP-dependent DNA helicase PcrA
MVLTAPLVSRYQPGQRVFHAKFGEGAVKEVDDRGDDQEVAVAFIRHGTKRLLASLAGMDIIDDEHGMQSFGATAELSE